MPVGARVRDLVLLPNDSDDVAEHGWLAAAARNPALAFLADPVEDIYRSARGDAPVADVVRIDPDEAACRIAQACADLPEVAAALPFGSALGPCRPDSDIDVGVFRRDEAAQTDDARFHARLRLEYDVLSRLRDLDGHPFDVTGWAHRSGSGRSYPCPRRPSHCAGTRRERRRRRRL